MKKKFRFALLLAILALCLSGCRSGYTRTEVRLYTWKLLGYSPFFTLSEESVPIWDHEHYRNYVWTVKTKGLDPLEFRVAEAHGSSLEWGTVGLVTDYTNVVLAREAEKFDEFSLVTPESYWKDDRLGFYLNASFSSREELDAIFQELTEFHQHMDKHYNLKRLAPYAVTPSYPIQISLKTDWPDYFGSFSYAYPLKFQEAEPQALADLRSQILRYAVEHQHPFKDDFTREEICAAVGEQDLNRLGISWAGPDGPYQYYDDLCNVTDEKTLCYRTLYEIMRRENLPIGGTLEGTVDHFVITNAIDQTWEFSSDFYDLDEEGMPHFYHFAYGEKIEDGRRPRIDIDTQFVYMTGFYLIEASNDPHR